MENKETRTYNLLKKQGISEKTTIGNSDRPVMPSMTIRPNKKRRLTSSVHSRRKGCVGCSRRRSGK